MTLVELVDQLRAPDQRGAGRVQEAEYGVPNVDKLMRLDSAAEFIYAWDHMIVPGLLQTPTYSLAVLQASNPQLTPEAARRRMLMKSARAEAFASRMRDARLPHRAQFIVGEQALRRTLSVDARCGQLQRLLELAELPTVTVQALPDHIVPPALTAHLALWTFDESEEEGPCPLKRVAYTETVMGGWYSTRIDDLTRARSAISTLSTRAASPYRTRQMIKNLLGERDT